MPKSDAVQCVRAAPLTQEAFGDFGEVIEHRGPDRRHGIDMNLCGSAEGLRDALWVSKLWTGVRLPIRVTHLERHPFSDQAFIPLDEAPMVIVVCPHDGDGAPVPGAARAFVGSSRQGVIYRRNVWHAALTTLAAPAEFVVVMALSDQAANDELIQLARPLEVIADV